MRKIFFFSKVFSAFCKNNNAGTDYIIDYYDIEAQKVLYSIGFKIKMLPSIYFASSCAQMQLICDMYDLDNYMFVDSIEGGEVTGVVFVCR